ncbi:hypothetical protein [Pseudanabaena sp. PCC 6802]|uniref:hypothetical protein n=1 Tax=Pseudanabaena sp. PCC 6802 TaxID=118173 RepID=UPI000349ACCF|nr:hypothetical protein [Pseudanabaena sp. PCC 6802]
MSDLSPEKEFAHALFCQQVEGVDLESARKLLKDLHLLYLGQQALFAQLAKRDFGAIEKSLGERGI